MTNITHETAKNHLADDLNYESVRALISTTGNVSRVTTFGKYDHRTVIILARPLFKTIKQEKQTDGSFVIILS